MIVCGFAVSVCADNSSHDFAAGETLVVENSVVSYKGRRCALELPELECLLRDGIVTQEA